ncbi:MAG: phage tail tape measure protein [Clostridium sp.]|nr:phage tail tape measure protein [Clostridium sp.]
MAQNVEEMVVKWSIDSTDFNKGVTSINRSMNVLKSEFKATDTNLKNFGSTTDQLKNKQDYLSKTMELQAKKIETLKNAYEKSKRETGENSSATERLAIQVNNATSYYSNLDKQLQDVTTELEQYNNKSSESTNNSIKIGVAMATIGEGAQALGQKLSNITAKIKEIGQAAMSNYKEIKSGTDEVIKATGATGDAAEDLKESFKDVASNSTADFKVIGTTLGEINTRFGFTGDSAEECTNKFIAFAKVTNSDATEAVKKVSRYMGDASINSDQYSRVLDNLAKAAQTSGISVSNLTENLTKYGAPMRALGFETEQNIALFSSWEKAGVDYIGAVA